MRADAVNGDDARMFQLSVDLGLPDETGAGRGVVRVRIRDLLEGDFAAELFVARSRDPAEPAASVLRQNS
jgi:hypothetical protein